ncbi:MAG: hypothetical protein WAS50_12485, partial [Nitrospira sp.]
MTTTINNGPTPTHDPFDTALITRLAQEFFLEQAGHNTSPATLQTFPASAPGAPGLAGGYPSA